MKFMSWTAPLLFTALIIFSAPVFAKPLSPEQADKIIAAAKKGDAEAQMNFASMLFNGVHMAQNKEQAFKWLLKSAKQGWVESQLEAGRIYTHAFGYEGFLPKNYKKGFKWLLRAAEQGDAEAQARVGVLYVEGTGVKRDYVAAYKWFKITKYTSSYIGAGSTSVKDAQKLLEKDMTAGDIFKARRMAREWKASWDENKRLHEQKAFLERHGIQRPASK
jgi:hypothetical protein